MPASHHPVPSRPPRLRAYTRALHAHFRAIGAVGNIDFLHSGRAPDASVRAFALGCLNGSVHEIRTPHCLAVGPRTAAAGTGGLECYVIYEGDLRFETASGSLRLSSGQLALLDSAQPFVAQSSGVHLVALPVLADPASTRTLQVGRPIACDAGLGACVSALLRTACAPELAVSVEGGALLGHTVIQALQLLAAPDGADTLAQRPRFALLRLKQEALRQLHCPALTPETVARQAGVSTRTLHRLFRASGQSFREWLTGQRLQRAYRLLQDTRQPGAIARIAFDCGFGDLRTFNRVFRARFGAAPRDCRRQGLVVAS